MPTEKAIFLLTNTGIHETTTDFSWFSTTTTIGNLSTGCLTHDARKPSFWYGDQARWTWRLFNPETKSPKPEVYANAWKYIRAVQFDQMTGNALFLVPFKESYSIGGRYGVVTKYNRLARSESELILTIGGVKENIFYALDMKIDAPRRKVWILDAGNRRVLRANVDTGSVDRIFSPVGMSTPCSMTVDISTGEAYVRCLNAATGALLDVDQEGVRETIYKAGDNGMIPLIETQGSTQYSEKWLSPSTSNIDQIILNNEQIPVPLSDSMKFDQLRGNLWWASKGEDRIIFMVNVKGMVMTSLSLQSELDYLSAIAIDHDSGRIIACGSKSSKGRVIIVDETCSVFIGYFHQASSIVNNIMVIGSEFGNSVPFYVNGVTSNVISDDQSSSSSIDPEVDVEKINNSLIAEAEVSDESGSSEPHKDEIDTTATPIVTVKTWGTSYGVSSTRVWTAKDRPSDENVVLDAVLTPMLSWTTSAMVGKPAIAAVTLKGDLVKIQYDPSSNSILETGRCIRPVEGLINGMSVTGGDGNVYVSGDGGVAKVNFDPTTPGDEEVASSLSESSSSSISNGFDNSSPLVVSQRIGDTGIGGISVQFHSKSATVYAVSCQDGTLISFDGIQGWNEKRIYGPLPAPFKALWSRQHSGVVVACKHSVHLVSVPSGVIKTLYGTPGYEVTDICVKDGNIGISLAAHGGSDGLFKVLAADLTSNRILYRTSGEAPSSACFTKTGKIVVALERMVRGSAITRFVEMNIGEEPGQPGEDVSGSVSSVFLDENFGITFAVFLSGAVSIISNSRAVFASGIVSDGVQIAEGSLVSGLMESLFAQKKVRVFVGSSEGLNDRWDSGEVRTSSNEMLYGGGDNLEPGEAYWLTVAIQESSGEWSEPFSKKFIVPIM